MAPAQQFVTIPDTEDEIEAAAPSRRRRALAAAVTVSLIIASAAFVGASPAGARVWSGLRATADDDSAGDDDGEGYVIGPCPPASGGNQCQPTKSTKAKTQELDKPGGTAPGGYNTPTSGNSPELASNASPELSALQNLVQERFCISDDTCVDYDGSDYVCVAGKCVPMGGQPSPEEPSVEALVVSDKPGGMAPGGQSAETPSTERFDKPGGTAPGGYNTPTSGNSPEFVKLVQERFCISDDTCVDYDGSDYVCVAGKCVPMGGQPSPEEPSVEALAAAGDDSAASGDDDGEGYVIGPCPPASGGNQCQPTTKTKAAAAASTAADEVLAAATPAEAEAEQGAAEDAPHRSLRGAAQ